MTQRQLHERGGLVESAQEAIRLLRPHRVKAILLTGSSVLAGLTESVVVAVIAQLAAALVEGGDRVQTGLGPLAIDTSVNTLLFIGFGAGLLRVLVATLNAYLGARISADVRADMRRNLIAAYTRAAWPSQAKDKDGYFIEVATSQVNDGGILMKAATEALTMGVIVLVMLLSAFLISPIAAIGIIVAGAFLTMLLRPVQKRARRGASGHSSSRLLVAEGVANMVASTEEMHVFGSGRAHRDRLNDLIVHSENRFFSERFGHLFTSQAFRSIAILLVIGGLALLKIFVEPAQLITLGAAVLILIRASTFGQLVQTHVVQMMTSVKYAQRVRELTDYYAGHALTDGTAVMAQEGSVVVRNVRFSYDGTVDHLQKVSVEIPARSTVGIVGPSGAGKSTLLQLLLGLRTPTEGQILVGGVNLADIAQAERSRYISYVPQSPRLIAGTIAENIRYFRDDLDHEDVVRAAKLAGVHEEILELPDGYDTAVGKRSETISGGQRQRVCIARALAGSPRVLFLDEPTSSLDVLSETRVQEALAGLRGRMTVFIVSHRLSALRDCDMILSVRGGVVEPVDPATVVANPAQFHSLIETGTELSA